MPSHRGDARPRGNRRRLACGSACTSAADKRGSACSKPCSALTATDGPVPRRVAALLCPPPHSQLLVLAAAIVLVAVSGLSAVEAARDLHALLATARAGTS